MVRLACVCLLACVFIFWNTFKVYILKLQPSPSLPVIHTLLMSRMPWVVFDFAATLIGLSLAAYLDASSSNTVFHQPLTCYWTRFRKMKTHSGIVDEL